MGVKDISRRRIVKISNHAEPIGNKPNAIRLAGHTLDFQAERLLTPDGDAVDLRRQAFAVLSELALNAGSLVTKDELIARIWTGAVVSDDSLVQAVRDARYALGDETHQIIETVRGRGYRISRDQISAIQASQSGKVSTDPPDRWWAFARKPIWVLALASIAVFVLGVALSRGLYGDEPAATGGSKSSLAVLQFTDMPNAHTDAAFRAGFAEELIMELARSRYLRVISRHSSFFASRQPIDDAQRAKLLQARYLVSGQLGRDEDRLLIRLQVVDTDSSQVVLSMKKTATGPKLDDTRLEILDAITANLHYAIEEREQNASLRRNSSNLDVYALAMRVLARKHTFDPDQYLLGRAEGERALKLDPTYAPAWVNLAFLNFVDAANLITGQLGPSDIPEADKMLSKGLSLDAESPKAWQLMSHIRAMQGRMRESLTAAERAERIAPGDPDTLFALAKAQTSGGNVKSALATFEKASLGYPIKPPYFHAFRARAHYAAGNHEKAINMATDCLGMAPKLSVCWIEKVASQVATGKTMEAKQSTQQMLELIPTMSQKQFGWTFQNRPELMQARMQAAHIAGVPERPMKTP